MVVIIDWSLVFFLLLFTEGGKRRCERGESWGNETDTALFGIPVERGNGNYCANLVTHTARALD